MHLDEGTIHAWLDGALDAEEAARVERHAAECGACAAAVAEARGLVAGASRILTALDGVPGGIVPKTTASGGALGAKRARSLWTSLHLTPARAAAAAIVVAAAGTALVLQNAPNAARSAVKLANLSADSAVTFQPAAPMAVPRAAPDSLTSRRLAAPTRGATSPARAVIEEAAPQTVATSRRRAAVGAGAAGRVGGVAVAEGAKTVTPQQLAALDSNRRERSVDSIASKKEAAMVRSAVADNATRGAVAGAAQPAPSAPPSAAAQRYSPSQGVADARSIAGCYVVIADSAIGLPPRLWLDSSLVAQAAMLQQRQKAAAADAAAPERHGVSEIANAGRRSIAGAHWLPRPDGSIRLSLPASSVNVDLFPTSGSTLVGAMAAGNRSVTVTLRRVECGL